MSDRSERKRSHSFGRQTKTQRRGGMDIAYARPTEDARVWQAGQRQTRTPACPRSTASCVCCSVLRRSLPSSFLGQQLLHSVGPWGVCLAGGAQRRHLYQDKHTSHGDSPYEVDFDWTFTDNRSVLNVFAKRFAPIPKTDVQSSRPIFCGACRFLYRNTPPLPQGEDCSSPILVLLFA